MTRSIAHYNLLEKIGEGGLGSVYRARDTKVGRTVALKAFPADPAARNGCPEALVADARAASAVSHPNVAALFDIGQADGSCYLAYEFVAGAPLSAAMAGSPMHPRRAVELATQIADALADLEAAGLVHGDLRPDTVAVTGKGAAKLLDSGMSRWTRGGALRRTAATDPDGLPPDAGSIVNYLSPEQALGDGSDRRADLFSLGTILYEMVSGRNPFAAATPRETVVNVTHVQPPPVSSVNPDVLPELDLVIAKAMAKDIAQRYDSAAIFASDLRRVALRLEVAAAKKSDEPFVLPVDDRADRIPIALWLAGITAIGGVIAAVWWSLQ